NSSLVKSLPELFGVNLQASLFRFQNHPDKRGSPKAAFVLGIAATDVAMNPREPPFFYVLFGGIFRRRPEVLSKEPSSLIYSDGMAHDFNGWIVRGIWKMRRVPYPTYGRHRVPHSEQMDPHIFDLCSRFGSSARERGAEASG